MSADGSADDPVIGEGGVPNPEEMVEELRQAAEQAIEIAREGAQEKEQELWARYRELTKGRREERKR